MHRLTRRQALGQWAGLVGAWALAGCTARAAGRVARVGWIGWAGDTGPDASVPLKALRAGLAELGWREGDNLVIEQRLGEREQGPALAADLLRSNPDVLVTQGVMVFAARNHTAQVPVVFGINGDPVEAGLASSFARPGGLFTGITALAPELAGKRLELLKSTRPGMQRVAVIANNRHPGLRVERDAAEAAAQRLRLQLQVFGVGQATEMEAAFAAIAAAKGTDAFSGLFAFPDTLINRQSAAIATFARQQRLPSISGWPEFCHAGNLMSYGPSHAGFHRHLAHFVDRILRGAKPAELPIELPTRFQLVLNQSAARASGLTLPADLRAMAEEVIA